MPLSSISIPTIPNKPTQTTNSYINIPEWENLFRNTQWMNPEDVWYLGPSEVP